MPGAKATCSISLKQPWTGTLQRFSECTVPCIAGGAGNDDTSRSVVEDFLEGQPEPAQLCEGKAKPGGLFCL